MQKFGLSRAMALLALIGLADSSYLTAHHYLGSPLRCGIAFDCTSVTSSAYSVWFHVPVALFGALYYTVILVLSLLALEAQDTKAQTLACGLTVIGFISSAWFVFVQAFVLHQWCEWCLGSAATSTALFVLGMHGIYTKHFRRSRN